MFLSVKLSLCEIGFALLFLATSIAQIIRLYTGKDNSASPIILALSLVLITRFKNRIRLNKYMILMFIYQSYILLIALMAKKGVYEGNGLIYTLFVLAMIMVLSTVKEINGDTLVSWMWGVSGIANLFLSLYFLTNNFETINIVYVGDVIIAERVTLATLAYMHVIASLVFKSQNKKSVVIKLIFILCAFYNIVITMRRGMFIALIIIFALHIYLGSSVTINVKKLFRNLFIVLIIILVCTQIPYVSKHLDEVMESVKAAIKSYIGNEVTDTSAVTRADARARILNDMNNFKFKDWLFGKGYNAGWIDFPFLQAFYDMGIVGGIIYILAQTYLPLRFLFTKGKNMARCQKMLFYLYIITFTNNFYSGTPYGYIKYIFVLPFYMDWAVNGIKAQKKDGRNMIEHF